MNNVLLINGHQPHPTSPGNLNAAFVQRARSFFDEYGFEVRQTDTAKDWSINQSIEDQLWADVVVVQFPLNSMSAPWSLKRYLDEVFTAGMDGRLASGDGRSRRDPDRRYGSGGLLQDKRYMLSLTLNAPRAAFDDQSQPLFRGRSLEELLAPIHINFSFFGMVALPTFAAYNVSKAPDIESDFNRFDRHLNDIFNLRSEENGWLN